MRAKESTAVYLDRIRLQHTACIAVASRDNAFLDDDGGVSHITHARAHERVSHGANGAVIVIATKSIPIGKAHGRCARKA